MRTRDDGSKLSVLPVRVFTPEYLELLGRRDEPVTAGEADAAGPWHLEPHPEGGWAVLREGESLARGHQPEARLADKSAARLVAAVLPGTGREPRYRLGEESDGEGFRLLDQGQVVGHFQHFHQDLLEALNVVDAVVSSPRSYAQMMDAAGGLALEHVDKIAGEMVAETFSG